MSLIGFSYGAKKFKRVNVGTAYYWYFIMHYCDSIVLYNEKKEITKNLILIKNSIKLLYMVCTILKLIKVMILKK